MKINLFLFFLPFISTFHRHVFSNKYQHSSLYNPNTNMTPNPSPSPNPIPLPIPKIQHLKRLIRAESILPTFLLCFTGGFIVNPSIIGLLQTPSFIISTINTIWILSGSMIINDIFDIENDKIDHPDRPLTSGNIKKREAVGYLLGLLSLTECLNVCFLPENIQTIIHLSIFNLFLYTPIYKKIPFVKNIFCAGMVSFSIFLAGLTASNKELLIMNPRFSILSVALSILFFGSWYNEVLLDIGDVHGDRENRIYTVPVLYGVKNAWVLSGLLLFFNILSNSLSIYYLFGRNTAIWLPCIFSPIIYHYCKIYRYDYKKEVIKSAVKNMRKSLFLLVIFLCGLSFIHSEGFRFWILHQDIHWLNIATTVFT